MKNGILVIHKEKNMTSRDVVNVVCKKLHTRHVGHTGTLDPLATGVLVLGVNDGCKIIDLLTSDNKEYIADVLVGIETDTLDVTGKVLKTYNIEKLTKQEVEKVLEKFHGKYMQEVPIYSAIHVNGKRLYEYARNNEDVELPKREVEVSSIELIDDITFSDNHYSFKIKVAVSKGTYIRSLIRDIGKELGIPCVMKGLTRTKQGVFEIENSLLLDEINEDTKLLKIEEALINYPKLVVDKDIEIKVRNGAILDKEIDSNHILIFNENKELLAIYQKYQKDLKKIKPYKVFGGN